MDTDLIKVTLALFGMSIGLIIGFMIAFAGIVEVFKFIGLG